MSTQNSASHFPRRIPESHPRGKSISMLILRWGIRGSERQMILPKAAQQNRAMPTIWTYTVGGQRLSRAVVQPARWNRLSRLFGDRQGRLVLLDREPGPGGLSAASPATGQGNGAKTSVWRDKGGSMENPESKLEASPEAAKSPRS